MTLLDMRCPSAEGSANAHSSARRSVASSFPEHVIEGPVLAKPEADGRDLSSGQEK